MRAPLLVAALAACVPATQDNTVPRGAAGARVAPSSVARGTAFVTTDGWTVTFEQMALVADLSMLTREADDYRSQIVIWDAAHGAETFVSAMPVGQLAVKIVPAGLDRLVDLNPEVPNLLAASKLAPVVQARILAAPDNVGATYAGYTTSEPLQQGPAVIFAARAEKDGRTLHITLALASAYRDWLTFSTGLDGVQALDVQANDVRFAAYEVHPERIFAASADDAATLFQPIADADRDGDGAVTDYVPGTTNDQGNRGDANFLSLVNAYRATRGLAAIPESQIDSNRYNRMDIRVSKAIASSSSAGSVVRSSSPDSTSPARLRA